MFWSFRRGPEKLGVTGSSPVSPTSQTPEKQAFASDRKTTTLRLSPNCPHFWQVGYKSEVALKPRALAADEAAEK
jgi:hypothetical protein